MPLATRTAWEGPGSSYFSPQSLPTSSRSQERTRAVPLYSVPLDGGLPSCPFSYLLPSSLVPTAIPPEKNGFHGVKASSCLHIKGSAQVCEKEARIVKCRIRVHSSVRRMNSDRSAQAESGSACEGFPLSRAL